MLGLSNMINLMNVHAINKACSGIWLQNQNKKSNQLPPEFNMVGFIFLTSTYNQI